MLIELFYIGMPVVWMDGQVGGRAYSHMTTKISRVHGLPKFLTQGVPLCVLHTCKSSANILLFLLSDWWDFHEHYVQNLFSAIYIVFEWRV